MRKFITNYVKNCLDCTRFKASNQKPSGLLQTQVQAQRFETIAIYLFGILPESKDKKKWIFIVEDVISFISTRWVEVFALPNATTRECATVLMEEVFLRFGLPRRPA
ncbi:hypothetical protein AVEN_81024-1 [Araneus ventricosus]|uniref:Integrase catalytic domain-containing protein n=1 Tax=Araneus ventricosus TaxID=182803 RepID=A0A4Y2FWA2_ARAVE|nr:hypothetical protein AVEN_251794-1 [Araneus ventricosus]GBM45618.1 hypothetical protein AVEN_51927-1 [Araneus ventricosus]GBM45624.1 hypothetical protein AVEN_62273-1 [Araneus ventricosus]GBM45649.1 hypothetical protein AVEN_81024-1 [Araneus ventricosus]